MKKNKEISIARAIGILFMVMGHIFISSNTLFIHDFVYLFHMPLFFILSGLCFSSKNLVSFKSYLKKKIFSLYFPYVFWFILFAFLHNFLFDIGIYDINDLWGGEAYYSIWRFGVNIYNIVVHLDGKEILVGQLWFVRTLFFVSIMGWIIIRYIPQKYIYCILVVLILFSPIICYVNFARIPFVHFNNWVFFGLCMFLFGYIYKKWFSLNINFFITFLIMFVLLIFSYIHPVGNPFYKTVYQFFFTGILGYMFVISISKKLATTSLSKILVYVGDRTLSILILHFIVFRLITYFIILLTNDDYKLIINHPLPKEYVDNYWFYYLCLGIIIPLLLDRIYLMIEKVVRILYLKQY